MTQKQINLLCKIEREALDGVNQIIAEQAFSGYADRARVIAECRTQLANTVVERLRDHFSIQNKKNT